MHSALSPLMHGSSKGGQLQPARGLIRGPVHLFPLRVYYEDTDLSGIVYHANYLRFMERARSDLLSLLGIDQRAAIEAGEGAFAVASLAIAYRRPARLDDALVVETGVTRLNAASIHLAQRILRTGDAPDAPGEVLSDGDVRIGFIAPDGHPRRQPASWRDKFRHFTDHGAE